MRFRTIESACSLEDDRQRTLETAIFRRPRPRRMLFLAMSAGLIVALLSLPAHAQQTSGQQLSNRTVIGGNVKQHADAVLAVMSYTTVPDVTTSSLSINNSASGNPGLGQPQLGGGFTIR